MQVIKKTSDSDIATVYIARNDKGKLIEFVESTQPPLTIKQKWVLIISTLFGCPVDCKICDAGSNYSGKMSFQELKFQVDYLIAQRFPTGFVDTDKFKIQFARMGEPAFNDAVLDYLEAFPSLYSYRYFIPSLSTIAPAGSEGFFERLLEIKKSLYKDTFQLQFSIHSTDEAVRNELIPIKKWDFKAIANFSERFYDQSGKKITLNFALSDESMIDTDILKENFDPDIFLIKLTPLNPTFKSMESGLKSLITKNFVPENLLASLKESGYDVLVSIGEWEENKIGSNCGQFIQAIDKCNIIDADSYSYSLINV